MTAPVPMRSIALVAVTVRNIPGSLLVVHAFAEKAKQEIRDKQQKKARKAKAERRPEEEFNAARHRNGGEWDYVPISALKKSIVSAATAFDDLTKVALRQALFLRPEHDGAAAFARIERHDGTVSEPVMREDAVTIGINTRGLAYRPQYDEWQLRFLIEFNSRLVSEEQLRALVDQAGWGVGICEGRPERSSALGWGRFEVVAWERVN